MATQKQKIEQYEALLHDLHVSRCITLNHDRVVQLLNNIDSWSTSHTPNSQGSNPSDSELKKRIDTCLFNLTKGDKVVDN